MRINNYSVVYEKPGRNLALVKESARQYEADLLTSEDVFRAMRSLYNAEWLTDEHVWIIAVGTKLKSRAVFEISHGSGTCSLVPIREIMRDLLLVDATGFFLVHNHPSGNITPSKEDDEVTKHIKNAADVMQVEFLDHLIIGIGTYYSYHMEGRI